MVFILKKERSAQGIAKVEAEIADVDLSTLLDLL